MKPEQVVHLDSGWWVRLQVVPSLAVAGIRSNPKYWMRPPPEIEVKTKAGTEATAAPYSSPEYQAYLKELEEVRAGIELDQRHFIYDMGVVEWSEDKEKWSDKPPKGWKCDPRILEAQGLSEDDIKPRTAWIMFYLIRSGRDITAVNEVIVPTEMRNVSREEIAAGEDFFRGDLQGRSAQGIGEGDPEE